MAALFNGSNTEYITQAAPQIVTWPFTVGFWCRPIDTSAHCMWSLCNSGSVASWRAFTSATNFTLSNHDGTTGTNCQIAGGATTGEWHYAVARVISASNRKIDVFKFSGPTLHSSNTTTPTAPVPVKMTIGAYNSNAIVDKYNGTIAEFFMADCDVQPDGAQLDDALLFQLAFKGPWSVPHIAANITEYISFRGKMNTGTAEPLVGSPPDFYQRKPSAWLSDGPSLADHPPLYGTYVRPNQNRRLLVV